MTQKIKSLIYLSCFVFAAVLYNSTVEETNIKLSNSIELNETNSIADSHTEDQQSNTIN